MEGVLTQLDIYHPSWHGMKATKVALVPDIVSVGTGINELDSYDASYS